MACIVIAHAVMGHVHMAYVGMASIVMASVLIACVGMASLGMTSIALASIGHGLHSHCCHCNKSPAMQLPWGRPAGPKRQRGCLLPPVFQSNSWIPALLCLAKLLDLESNTPTGWCRPGCASFRQPARGLAPGTLPWLSNLRFLPGAAPPFPGPGPALRACPLCRLSGARRGPLVASGP